ncbi:lipopolysaccharide kinase [Azoarcus indigens]|uniref:Lipopolysaccharide kinase (Kdo/WaaP) family protein n=1 Tax=Azoarcus indigens TaxID=29545 RepID=A0A4R6E3T6_9RHOO|nr:lipopolysaccharide kinase InaA family protein [Azoarcus indigens]NMG64659.1 lipopolysaccharide kinase [Azoarcus indigens]TDN52487.1 lipopolysaccharide kinase (Kdo/WaaP) family protein [Azoarcus indigens]
MTFYLADDLRPLFTRHGLDSFGSLWALELDSVDAPNTGRGGWSSVSRLELADEAGRRHAFYLKRQIDHLSRSPLHPLGEATFAREFRNIRRYAQAGIPALQAAFFGQRKLGGKVCAMLITRALDDYRPLDAWLQDWPRLGRDTRRRVLDAAAVLVRTLHKRGQVHNCLYPKHLFIRLGTTAAQDEARLIDLEKTRPLWLGAHDRARDLDALNRHADRLPATDRLRFLLRYLGRDRLDAAGKRLARRILDRHRRKAARR